MMNYLLYYQLFAVLIITKSILNVKYIVRITRCRLPIITCSVLIIRCGGQITRCLGAIARCGAGVTKCGVPITRCGVVVTNWDFGLGIAGKMV